MPDGAGQSAKNIRREPRRSNLLPLERLTAFSDGVFSIVITILVLELAVPSGSEPLLASLQLMLPSLLGYFVSFAFVGGFWLSHSGLTKLMKTGDSIAYGLNLLMLLLVSLLPFTTSLMVKHLAGLDIRIAVIIYGLNVLLASLTLSFLMIYIAGQPRLVIDELAHDALKRLYRQRWIATAVGICAVALSIVAPLVAVALYLVEALLFLVLPLVVVHRTRHSTTR